MPSIGLNGAAGSCWVGDALTTDYPRFEGEAEAEAVIVGGGIAGMTAALALREAGTSVILLEARRIGRQVTGRSTAKITTQHNLIYRHLIDTFGADYARAYAEANAEAANRIRGWIESLRIACDYEPKSAFLYATTTGWKEAMESEAEAARSLGLEARVLDRAPLPFPTAAGLEFPGQAQFNPAQYLAGLASAIHLLGGKIFEQSRATKFDHDGRWRVSTAHGTVSARHVVMATNLPVKSPAGYANRTQPRCHVAMAFRTASASAIDGMFLGLDEPTHSIRTGRDREGPLIVVLGPHFNTGQDGDVARRFVDLEQWAQAHLPAGQAAWRWCNEDYDTADRVPFVGQPAPDKAPGFHVATGFNAWGITNGTAAGRMIAAEIAQGARPWGNLFDATRGAPEGFHRSGDTQSRVDSLDEIGPGEAGVVERDGEKLAVRRDEDGALHVLSASCTHKGCTVTWNNADRTWDCPCHGSVFEADGTVFHGPARKPLERRSV